MKKNMDKALFVILLLIAKTAFSSCTSQELLRWFDGDKYSSTTTASPVVWVIDDGLTTHDKPNEKPTGTLDPFESYEVVRQTKQGEWLLVNNSSGTPVWINSEHPSVLCRNSALRGTDNGIARKGILLVKPVYKENEVKIIPYLNSAMTTPKANTVMTVYKPFYVMAQIGDAVLLATDYSLDKSLRDVQSQFIGWFKYSPSTYADWLTKATIEFKNKPGISVYTDQNGTVDRKVNVKGAKWELDTPRFAVLDKTKSLFKIAYIAGAQDGEVDLSQTYKLGERTRVIGEVLKSANKVNLVFVIDATHSMENTIKATINTAKKIARNVSHDTDGITFSLHIYRDTAYQEAHSNYLERGSLDDFIAQLETVLNTFQDKLETTSHDDSLAEDIAGIEPSISSLLFNEQGNDTTNIGILMSNAGDRQYSSADIAGKLKSLIPHWCVYKAAHQPNNGHAQAYNQLSQLSSLLAPHCTISASDSSSSNQFVTSIKAILGIQKDFEKMVYRMVTTGESANDASRDIPAVISQVFKDKLGVIAPHIKFDERALSLVSVGWVKRADVDVMLLISRQEMTSWRDSFKKIINAEVGRDNQALLDTVVEVFADILGEKSKDTREKYNNKTLEFLFKRSGIPIPRISDKNSILSIPLSAISSIGDQQARSFIDKLTYHKQVYDLLLSSRDPEVLPEISASGQPITIVQDGGKINIWFKLGGIGGDYGYFSENHLP